MQKDDSSTMKTTLGTSLTLFTLAISAKVAAAQNSWQVEPLANGLPARVHAVHIRHVGGDPVIFAAGGFMKAGNQFVNRVAQWDGQSWMPMAAGLGGPPVMLKFLPSFSQAIFVGGYFKIAVRGPRTPLIAQWESSGWSAVGGDIGSCSTYDQSLGVGGCNWNAHVRDIVEFDPDGSGPAEPLLYIAGIFPQGTLPYDTFAWRIGGEWQTYSAANGLDFLTLLKYDDGTGEALYGIGLRGAGPLNPPLCRWNGTAWSSVPGTSPKHGHAGVVHDAGDGSAIYLAVSPTATGSSPLRFVMRWDGTGWQQISETFNNSIDVLASSTTTSSTVTPFLIAAGNFTQIGSTTVNRLALWNGTEWTQLADVDGRVRSISLDVSGPRPLLLIGGDFLTVNGVTVNRIALLKGPSLADLNGDGHVNAADLGVLLGSWGNPGCAGGTPCPADLNNDGQVNAADLGILLGNWG